MSPSHSALHGNINHSLCPFFLPLCDTAAFASSISQFLLFVATLRGCSCDMRKTFSTIKIYGSSYLGKDGWVKCVSWNLSDAAAASYDLQHSLRLHYIHADFNLNTCTVAITLVYSAATWVFCLSEMLLDRKLGPEFIRSIGLTSARVSRVSRVLCSEGPISKSRMAQTAQEPRKQFLGSLFPERDRLSKHFLFPSCHFNRHFMGIVQLFLANSTIVILTAAICVKQCLLFEIWGGRDEAAEQTKWRSTVEVSLPPNSSNTQPNNSKMLWRTSCVSCEFTALWNNNV